MAKLGMNTSRCMLLGSTAVSRRGSPAIRSVASCMTEGLRGAVNPSKPLGLGLSLEAYRRNHNGSLEGLGLIRAAAGDEGAVPSEGDKDALGTLSSLKKFSWISFWIQLGLSLASAGVLFFTITTTQKTSIASFFLTVGVATSLISTVLVRLVLNKSRLIYSGENPMTNLMDWDVESLLLRNTDINLVGMASSIIALQGEIGLLVAKTLSSSSLNPYTAQQGGPAAIDVFAVQGAANVLLAHFCSVLLVTFLLRAIKRFHKRVAAA